MSCRVNVMLAVVDEETFLRSCWRVDNSISLIAGNDELRLLKLIVD